VRILERSLCYHGFFRLERYRLRHTLYAGGWSDELVRERVERGQAAAALLYDPARDAVVMVEQFRIGALGSGAAGWLLELVAGIVEPGEDPQTVARREAVEEAGCEIRALIPICEYLVSPGGSSERIALFCGRVDASCCDGIHGLAEEGEETRVEVLSFERAVTELYAGRIDSAAPIIAMQWLILNRDRVRRLWRSAP
jgi:ADP-ribose pyrophosphatase